MVRKSKTRAAAVAKPEIKDLEEMAILIAGIFKSNPLKNFSVKYISSTLHIEKSGQAIVREAFNMLRDNGVITVSQPGKFRYRASQEDLIEGLVDMTSSGSLYVIAEGYEKDIFVDANNTGHALHGDIVKVSVIRKRRNGTLEGEVVEIVKRNDKNYVGVVEASASYAFVIVDNKHVPSDIFVPLRDLKGAKNGDKVKVRILEWPMNMKNPVGEIIEVFGQAGEHRTEMHAILSEYELPNEFPEEVLRAAQAIPDIIDEKEIKARRDFRNVPTLTIDPFDAKDFDDALSVRTLENGNYEVGIHIADVTHYVTTGTLEDEARERATSVYLVDRVVPMLPERLSNGICSLRPDEEKLCFSAVFELDANANVLKEWFGRTIIKSDRRFAYEQAQKVIETGVGDMKEEILTMHTLAQKLRAERFKEGSINFERDEAKFVLDEHGKPLSVYFKESKDSNKLIEEFMLLANRKVAEFIGKKRPGHKAERTFVYRIHDKPNEEKLNSFKSFIVKFGYAMKADSGRAVAKELNRLLKSVEGKAEENLISTLAIRSMAKAIYSTNNIGHYGLAFDFYTHFTSPIRRYPDMMVHRLLAHYLDGGKSADKDLYEDLCKHSSEMEIRASEAERASIKYKMVEFMLDKIGEEFDGVISGVTEWGIYVELTDTKIEGMVSLRDIGDDYYVFDDKQYCAVGRVSGRVFTLGDHVRIKIKRADLSRKQLDFMMVAKYDFATKTPDHV